MEKLELKIIDYLTKHPKPKDETEFHKFAETISKEHGVAEEIAYEILGNLLAGGKSKGKILKVDSKELEMGIKIELEHTKDQRIAEKIARDHLFEIPDYYTRLKKMELEAEKSMKKAFIKIFDKLYVKMNKAIPKSTYEHSNKLGAGSKKRKKLKNPQDKVEAVMHEFKTGKLHSGSGKIVTDRKQAIAIAMSESGQSKYMKIEEKESGHKSVPKEYKGVKNFADNTNKKYPLDTEAHVRAAISYFAMPRNHSGYKPEERKTIAGKIRSAAKKYGINISEDWLKKFDLMEKARNVKYIKKIPKADGGYTYIYQDEKKSDHKSSLMLDEEKMQKARTYKYYKKEVKGNKTRYYYTKEEYEKEKDKTKGILSALMSFFGLKSDNQIMEKIKAEQSKHKELSGIDTKILADHLNEYFTNKDKWDKKLARKSIVTKDKKTGTIKKQDAKSPKASVPSEKKNYSLDIMRRIASVYGGEAKGNFDPMPEEEQKLNEQVKKKEIESIPEKFKDIIPEILNLEIISQGKKYFKVKFPGNYPSMNLYINKSSENLKTGDNIKIKGLKLRESNKYGSSTSIYPISDNQFEELKEKSIKAKTKSEINRWMGYVREAARKDYIYNKGVYKLQSLGIEKIENLNNELKDIKKTIREKKTIEKINNYLGYMQEAANKGYIYQNGLKTLKELKIEDYPEKQEKLNKILNQIEEQKQKEIEIKKEKTEKDKKEGRGSNVFVHKYAPALNIPIKSGEKIIVYEKTGKTFYLDPSDEFTFGFNPGGGRAANYYYRNATEDEIKQYNKNQEKIKKEKELKQNFNNVKNKVESMISQNGEYIKSDNQIKLQGKKYFDSMNIYGGGSYILIDDKEKYIWFVRNNGMDGDFWGNNNISTGGAGAIGKRIKYEGDIKKYFNELLESEKILNTIEKMQKAKNITKLTKKVITDKNGKQRTVYVRPNEEPKEKPQSTNQETKNGKTETTNKSKNRELLKNTIKKIADIVAQALKGGDTNPAAGRAVEQLGEDIKRQSKEKPQKDEKNKNK